MGAIPGITERKTTRVMKKPKGALALPSEQVEQCFAIR